MFKLIIRNILAHRLRYCWVFVELCLVALISWPILDKIIVNQTILSVPDGYDIDRLAIFSFNEYPKESNRHSGIEKTSEEKFDDIIRIIDRVRADDRVESATVINYLCFSKMALASTTLHGADTTRVSGSYFTVQFWPGTDFFKTFGIRDGADPSKPFVEPPMSGRNIIVSRSVADYLYPGENAVGKYLEAFNSNVDPEKYSEITGLTADALYRQSLARTPIVYKTRKPKNADPDDMSGVIRLKPGINVNRFIEDYAPVVARELGSGDIYTHSLKPYSELKKYITVSLANEQFISVSMAVFFLVNILLCMVGTFYLQTRRRAGETGVLRAFGATRGFILTEMLGEGFVMTTLAWLFGCGLYLFHLKHGGDLAIINNFTGEAGKEMMPMWVDDFNTHFAVVSLIIYSVMLVAVLSGIYIPARRISRINPVDALRDE